jgi:ABC-type dipeptide/oligopeptide/nickel transport system permease component
VSKPPRAAWQVALATFVITLAIGTAVGLIAAVASGAIHRELGRAVALYGRAVSPFLLIVTIAAYAIQRSRIAKP